MDSYDVLTEVGIDVESDRLRQHLVDALPNSEWAVVIPTRYQKRMPSSLAGKNSPDRSSIGFDICSSLRKVSDKTVMKVT
jgi:hypothetical protein